MGLFDSIVGSVMGSAGNSGALQSILSSALSGGQASNQSGLGGLVEQFARAGLGNVVNSWVGTGANQQVSPQQVNQVFGDDQIKQWSQQSGIPQDGVLAALSKLLPHTVDHMTPNGELPADSSSPFDESGIELPKGQ